MLGERGDSVTTDAARALARARWEKIPWRQTICLECRGPMLARRGDKLYCGQNCQKRARTRRLRAEREGTS